MPLHLRTTLAPCLALALLALPAVPASAIRIVSYNLLNYDNQDAARNPSFRTVIAGIGNIDIIAVQEMQDLVALNRFRTNVLEVVEPGVWNQVQFFDDPAQTINQAILYRNGSVVLVVADTLGNDPRDITYATFRPAGYLAAAAQFTIYATHWKAGSAPAEQAERLLEGQRLRAFMNTQPAGSNMIVLGDYNMQASTEGAYQAIVGAQANNIGRVFDPIATPGTWIDNCAIAIYHTQSPRTADLGDGGATGGLDDRFDQILVTSGLLDNEGLDAIEATYKTFGNDGLHCNLDISDPPVIPEGQPVADALRAASDHMPVILDFQVPAKISTLTAIDWGTVIQGAPSGRSMEVFNLADPPADELTYSIAPPAGFSTAAGPHNVQPDTSKVHTVSMGTATSGIKAGTLVLTTDDVDAPTWNVALSGTVLRHANPSLDGGMGVTGDTLEFGAHEEGGFTDGSVFAHNLGFDSLQALLDVYDAAIAGSSRFSLPAFSPVDVGSTPAEIVVSFDDSGAGAEVDSVFEGTLTLSNRDQQGIPGAVNRANLVVTLQATVLAGVTGASDPARPGITALLANRPNPFSAGTRIVFDLAEEGPVRLEVFDVQGRRMATLHDGWTDAGRHDLLWDGTEGDGAPAPPGVYFLRLETPSGSWSRCATRLQ